MRRFGLIGYPLSHSFSQKYFTEKFAQLGINDCVYDNLPVPPAGDLGAVFKMEALCGVNVTIPYKKKILAYLDEATDVVHATGACNCINIKDGQLEGYNTDVTGFERSLVPYLKPQHTAALVLGSGGASAAVEFVLRKLGIQIQFVSTSASPGSVPYKSVDRQLIHSHHLLINTTPLGMYPDVHECPAIPYEYLTPGHHLYDLVYNPAETKFLSNGKVSGATTQNGSEMLVIQAEESWRIWNS